LPSSEARTNSCAASSGSSAFFIVAELLQAQNRIQKPTAGKRYFIRIIFGHKCIDFTLMTLLAPFDKLKVTESLKNIQLVVAVNPSQKTKKGAGRWAPGFYISGFFILGFTADFFLPAASPCRTPG
jgi:hypothetical protein